MINRGFASNRGMNVLLRASKIAAKRIKVMLTLGLLATTSVLFLVRELSDPEEQKHTEEIDSPEAEPEPEPETEPETEPEEIASPDSAPLEQVQDGVDEIAVSEVLGEGLQEFEGAPETDPPEKEASGDKSAPETTKPEVVAPEFASKEASELYLQLIQKYGKSNKSGLKSLFSRWSDGPSPEERRLGMQRLSCSLEVHCVTTSSYHLGSVKNLSLGGAEIELDFEPTRRTRLGLQLFDGDPTLVTGTIIWSGAIGERYRAGIEFDLEVEHLSRTWVAQKLYELGGAEFLDRPPRKFVRIEVEVDTTLVLDDGTAIEVTLLDLSMGGCLLKSRTPLEVPELTLRLGKVNCRGMIVHRRQDDADVATWYHHHIRFKHLKRLERMRLRRTLLLLLKSRPSEAAAAD